MHEELDITRHFFCRLVVICRCPKDYEAFRRRWKTFEELEYESHFFGLVSRYANILSTVKENKRNCYAFIHLAEEVK
jgi:hypothetical protein